VGGYIRRWHRRGRSGQTPEVRRGAARRPATCLMVQQELHPDATLGICQDTGSMNRGRHAVPQSAGPRKSASRDSVDANEFRQYRSATGPCAGNRTEKSSPECDRCTARQETTRRSESATKGGAAAVGTDTGAQVFNFADAQELRQRRREKLDEPLLGRRQLARAISVSPRTIDRWVAKGMPVALRLWGGSGGPRFRVSDVAEWHESLAQNSGRRKRHAAST
jgi:hypothetical protein